MSIANELRKGAVESQGSPPSQDRGRQIKVRLGATLSEVRERSRPKMQFLAWSGGNVRFWNGVNLRDLGAMAGKEQAFAWCRANGVRFLEELPWFSRSAKRRT